jgi:hypothetical protein
MTRARWTGDKLARIGEADELELAACRPDGTLRPAVTIWSSRSTVSCTSALGVDRRAAGFARPAITLGGT